ncbi:hypothetical protein L1987_51630 [Smallanthus sonchifolius]|uniref:Uncharacterized protein n=1 Tax=Smallanthus sonchifolius TaxID=185202 RepID=A0ACB9ERH8_9ASTR|nr:hypothetical protein L1987_51630 [Smallanthus sonchifolius]
MDSYGFIDSIQVEKANALARYRLFNNISKMFRAIEVFIAVALISWSSTRLPTVFKVSGEYLYACSSYVLNQHFVFLVGNVIVVLCYVLSGHTEVGNGSDCSEVAEDNRFRSATVADSDNRKTSEADSNIEPLPVPVPPAAEVLPEMKQTAMEEEVEHEVVGYEKAIVKTESEMDAETAIKQAVKQIERFHRTQSAKLSLEISTKPRRELRRSVTERRRSEVATTTGDGDLKISSIETVERLSNEEFRLAVEAFISKQQNLLKQQAM